MTVGSGMKNPYIIPSLIIAAAILGGFWMVKPPSEPQKMTIVQPPSPPKDIFFTRPIHTAVMTYNIEAVKQHIAAGTDVNAKDNEGYTPLRIAASKGQKEIAELLITNGADVNAKDQEGVTPLHCAAMKRRSKEVVELLIANGADVNAKEKLGITPLDWAIEFEHPKNIDLLRKHGGKTGEELKAAGN